MFTMQTVDDEAVRAKLELVAGTTLDSAKAFELESDFRLMHSGVARHIGDLIPIHDSRFRAGVLVGAALMTEALDGVNLDLEFIDMAANRSPISPYVQLELF